MRNIPIQLHQNLNLLLFLTLGYLFANVHLSLLEIVIIILYTLLVEHILLYLNPKREFYLSYSAISTAVGVMVMLYSNSLYLYLILILLALLQKHYITIQNSHLFNPSNFAVVVGMVLFYREVHIVSGEFGNEIWLNIIFFIVALVMLIRVDRWIISLSFIIGYIIFEYLLVVSYDPILSFDMVYKRFYSISLMLFIYFMLTDPAVTPKNRITQAIFGLLLALLSSLLDRFYGYRTQHLFIALFILSPYIIILKSINRKNILIALLVTIFTLIVTYTMENKPPYYFEMEG